MQRKLGEPCPFHRTSQPLFGIRSLLDSKPYYSDLLVGCENTLGPLERKSNKKHWHRAMIGRFVPKDWDAAGFKMLVSEFGTFGTQDQGSISRAQGNIR
ncbi:hypothetical protein N0V95_001501 [Ascochyta clinopodiicola]|nr:hypothetical protein N0V95_001501 [Ascochyta clinopodiicola]